MSITSISSYGTGGTDSASISTTGEVAAAKSQKTQQTQKSGQAASVEDKVRLSAASQAKAMKKSGMSVSQIANTLALSTKTVNEYLGITSSTSASTAAALSLLE